MRNYINHILIVSGFLLAILSWNPAQAVQPVVFKPAQEYPANSPAIEFITNKDGFPATDIEIAQIDLNSDDIYEFIVKNTRCPPATECTYLIVAESEAGYIIIGEFSGKNISISDKQTHGIRDILVYNQKLNDYQHNTLKWSMENMRYNFNQKQAG